MKVQEIYSYILKLIKIVIFFIMGLVTTKTKESSNESLELSKSEYELLFSILKNSTFKGEDLEVLYKMASKLQKQYTSLYKNN